MKDYIPYIVIALICIALGYLIRLQVAKPPLPVKPDTIYVKGQDILRVDTVRIYKEQTALSTTHNDTAKATFTINNDSVNAVTDVAFAFIDSTFKVSQTIDCIARTIERTDTVKITVVETKELPRPGLKFYETSLFAFVSGIVVTLVIEIIAIVATM